MKKTHCILYTASVIGFYISLILLYLNIASAAGMALLAISILSLGAGVFFQWREASVRKSWISCSASEKAKAAVSC